MKALVFALLIATGLGLIIYPAIFFIVGREDLATGLGVLPIAGCGHIAEALERLNAKRSIASHEPNKIRSFVGFAVSWPMLVIYGTIAFTALYEALSSLNGFLLGLVLGSIEPTVGDTATLAALPRLNLYTTLFFFVPLIFVGGYFIVVGLGHAPRD